MNGEKILVVGATGQVALPLAKSLAKENEVWAVARFSDPAARASFEAGGVQCEGVDLVAPTGSEAVRPWRDDGQRFASYAEAMAALAPPRVLQNRTCYRLLEATA